MNFRKHLEKIKESESIIIKEALNFSRQRGHKTAAWFTDLRFRNKKLQEEMVLGCDVRVGVYKERRVNFL